MISWFLYFHIAVTLVKATALALAKVIAVTLIKSIAAALVKLLSHCCDLI